MADPAAPVSFWQSSLGPAPARPALAGDLDADVCIIGAGYTGLWTAWALAGADPSCRVVVLEAEHAGFGASGRNGGWLSGLLPGSRERLAQGPGGREGVIALQRALIGAVDEVVDVCAAEGIDADIHVGGTLAVATTSAQLARLRAGLVEDRRWGLGEADGWELGAKETRERIRIAGAAGSVFSPHCARIQPARLVRGLVGAVDRRGVTIYERTRAASIAPGRVVTTTGQVVRARWVVRATEGYTASLAGVHRRLLPMNSSMIVTHPLPDQIWERIGWDDAETVRDAAHAYTYLQRTADGRVAIGGRGVPYRFGSRLDRVGETPPATVSALTATLGRLLPPAAGAGVAAAWSGVLGVARDWCPSVGVTPAVGASGGMGWAGGYVGDGVTTSYLAGRTLADLILGRDTERIRLPWVGHISRAWEPEPLRWLGVHGIYALYRTADRAESRQPDRAATSIWARMADRVSGRP